jgi:site-specific DNA-methyltransferase (adenine-specific)
MVKLFLPRLDKDLALKKLLLPYCRFKPGDIWLDTVSGHKIGCLDASERKDADKLMDGRKAVLAIHDPPYNLVAFDEKTVNEFINWCKKWVLITEDYLVDDASLYIWLGADQKKHFQPFAEFIVMMKETGFKSRNYITMRNQRGYGTQKNWMSVRQELLYYTKGDPEFFINAEYTHIPKVTKGYYKKVKNKVTDNMERSKSSYLRAGNVWIDIQQVFYRLEENVNGCYAQKPLRAIERIVFSGSKENDVVIDFFAHAGTTLLASERRKRCCYTMDFDPVFCEITLRRLENFRLSGKTGWQNSNPFEKETETDKKIKSHLLENYGIQNSKDAALIPH